MARKKTIFTDVGSLIIRRMMADPARKWVVRDFVSELGVGRGWSADILAMLRDKGYLKGESRGRHAGSSLRQIEELIQEWTHHYRFEYNEAHVYYTHEKDFLPKVKAFFKNRKLDNAYGLTLHSGANLITHYVKDPNVYLYLDPKNFKNLSLDFRLALDLKELKHGGNVVLLKPYYKRSAIADLQKIKGYSVVSNLQLYLDLFHYPQRGEQHAAYLLRTLKEEMKSLA